MNIVGWREWLTLPELGIPGIKAKVDTGAKTSAIHAFEVDVYKQDDIEYVRFKIHPVFRKKSIEIECVAPLVDRRMVRDSGGHQEERLVIRSTAQLGEFRLEADFTLTSRDDMRFPMLLGRRALESEHLLVDVTKSYVHGRMRIREIQRMLASGEMAEKAPLSAKSKNNEVAS